MQIFGLATTKLGIPALLVPEAQGGIGLNPLDAAIVAESLGAHIHPITLSGYGCYGTDGPGCQRQQPTICLPKLQQDRIAWGSLSQAIKRRNDARVEAQDGHIGKSLFAFDADADSYLVADQGLDTFTWLLLSIGAYLPT